MKISKIITWAHFAKILPLLLLILVINGCGTVTPKVVSFKQPEFTSTPDATGTNYQNGGILGWIVDGQYRDYLVINTDARANYNSLISKLKKTSYTNDYGITQFTNSIVPSLWISSTQKSQPFTNTFPLWIMNPAAQDLYGSMAANKNNYIPDTSTINKTNSKSFFLK